MSHFLAHIFAVVNDEGDVLEIRSRAVSIVAMETTGDKVGQPPSRD